MWLSQVDPGIPFDLLSPIKNEEQDLSTAMCGPQTSKQKDNKYARIKYRAST